MRGGHGLRFNICSSTFTSVLVFLLVVSNIIWAYIYLLDENRDTKCLRVGASALAIMLGHTGHLLKEMGETGITRELMGYAYFNLDHAIIIAHALYELTGTNEWKNLYYAVVSLHSFIADMYQGSIPGKKKLLQVGEIVEELAKALKKLDTKNIREYSIKLLNLI